MRFDASTPERAVFEQRTFDVCVVGSGPAGITLARSLAAHGLDVALMEGGDVEWTPESQDLYVGENVGLPYHELDMARVRFFGGTSYHWNGACRELDAADFEARPNHPLSAWPIGKADLDPYQPAADAILDVSSPAGPDKPSPVSAEVFRSVHYRFSPPTRFGEKYLDEIAAAPRIFLGLNANLVDLRLDPSLRTVEAAVFRSYAQDDPGFTVRARRYCLCAGGVENARLLLNFRSQAPKGIGNQNDLVGRYFTEHPAFYLGEIVLRAAPEEDPQFFVPSEAFRRANDILGIVLRVNHMPPPATSFGREILRSAQCAAPFGDRLAEAVLGGAVPCDRGGIADYLRLRGEQGGLWARVVCNSEQALNPDSRVLLTEERDALGLNRIALDWRLSEIDYRTIKLATLELARQAAEHDFGRMRIYDWILAERPVAPAPGEGNGVVGSWHHMCTTRMSDDPRQGVVDRNCQVHGLDNLYIGGSSAFASAGYVNPTYTITQLALRLGDHLGEELHI